MKKFWGFLLVIVLMTSCGEYQSLLKSNDYNLVYKLNTSAFIRNIRLKAACRIMGNAYFHGKVSRSGFPLLWQGGTNR